MQEATTSFYGLGIAPKLIDVLEKLKFVVPTPIQHKSIPIALEGKDIIGIAQTGTGKTMAFGIPMVQRLMSTKGRGLVIVPTRELAIQVKESIDKIARAFNMKLAVLIGGDPIYQQIKILAQGPRILIATPGRLIDLMEQKKVRLNDVQILVLDEADRMLDMGFAPQIDRILKAMPKERQTALFSATMPESIRKIASAYMQVPLPIEVAPSGTAAERVTHELFIVGKNHKKELLGKLLNQYRGSILLFCRTKISTAKTARSIAQMGHSATEIHSNRSLAQRRKALEGFKNGRYRVLVATDIAARGIDVTGLELVINYDLPDDTENYVHRIGRTGRAGLEGHAITFASPDEFNGVRNIERLIKTDIPRSSHPDMPSEQFDKPKTIYSFKSSRNRPHSHRRRR